MPKTKEALTDDARPVWPFKIDMKKARFLVGNNGIEKVVMYPRTISEDEQVYRVELTNWAGKKITITPAEAEEMGLSFNCGWPGLLRIGQHVNEDRVRQALEAIENWDAKHEEELSEYDRLYKRFNGIPPQRLVRHA